MNIIEFKEKVYQRIITKYMKDDRKTKLTWENYSFITCIPIFSLIFSLSFYLYNFSDTFLNFLLLVSMLFSSLVNLGCAIIIISEFKHFKHFINFKKQSDIFWGTSLLSIPVLDDSEMKNFFLRNDTLHCKSKYTPEKIESLVAFTPKEIGEMKSISFNKEQKDLILNSIKNGIKINFYSLGELLKISDENIVQQKLLAQKEEKKNIDENKTILQAIGYNLVHEKIMPVNQKVKYLL